MRNAPVKTTAFRQGLHNVSKTQKERLGTLRILEDGRKFRYSQAGAVALDIGKATTAKAIAAAHLDATIAATNNNGTQVTLTITAGTAIAENALANGYLQVNDGLLEGLSCRIDSNTPVDAAGTSITVSLADRLVGYDGTTECSLVHNPWSGLVISATPEALFTGISPVNVPANYFFWSQTGGPTAALVSGTPAIGSMLTMSATDGALAAINATLDIDQPVVGIAWGTAGVAGEYKPVMLTVD